MSLILKGIDMPKKHEVLHLIVLDDGQIYVKHIDALRGAWMDKSQAIQIPKGHGRLIDANDVFTYDYMAQKQLDEVPTILESEE